MRAAAAAVISFCLAGAPLAGCRTTLSESAQSAETGTGKDKEVIQAEVGVLTTTPADAEAAPEPGPKGAMVPDAPEPAEAKPVVEAPEPCTDEASLALSKKLQKMVKKADSCGSIQVSYDWETGGVLATAHSIYDLQFCDPRNESLEERLEADLTQEEVDCLATRGVFVDGKRIEQAQKLVNRVFGKCPAEKGSAYWYSLMIEMDEHGKVLDIRPRKDEDQIPPDAIEGLKKALKGLSFPCLAGYQICPEYVIIE